MYENTWIDAQPRANPLDAFRQGQSDRRQEEAAALLRQKEAQAQEAQRRTQTLDALTSGAKWLSRFPEAERAAAFEKMAPTFAGYLSPEQIDAVRKAPKDDQSLAAFIGDAERQKLEFRHVSEGLDIAADPYTGAVKQTYRGIIKSSPGETLDIPPGFMGDQPAQQAAPSASMQARPQSNANPQDLDALTRMIATEAIGEGPQGMAAAGAVALNRARQGYGGAKSIRDVVYAPHQFEGMSRAQQVSPKDYAVAQQVAQNLLAGQIPDPTGGAVNFLNPDLQGQMGRQQPSWAPPGQGQRIGRHVFYGGNPGAVSGQAGQNLLMGGGDPTPAASPIPGYTRIQGAPKPQPAPSGYRWNGNALQAIPGGPADKPNAGRAAPAGYQWDGDHLRFIPGGPADPTVSRAGLKPVPAKVMTAISDNRSSAAKLDAAIKAVQANRGAFGLKNKLGDEIMQRLDPGGVDARSAVADVGSLIIHDRSGAAVTVSEFPRLAPFVPRATDTPEKVISNLKRLKRNLEIESEALTFPYGEGSGYRPVPDPEGGRPAQRQQQARPAQPARPAPPQRGQVVKGYRYNGGNPADPKSWSKVQ